MNTPFHATTGASNAASGPAGQRGTRAAVLLEMKQGGVVTAAALAASLDCAINTVRHHLKELESDGMVVHDLTHHGVGAPLHAYRLSARGHALFPDRYADTVTHLIDHVIGLQGRDASATVLRALYSALGERICGELADVPADQRGERIARALDEQGFMATWQPNASGGVLTEHNCPHRMVAERFPEICADEEAFLARAFGARVERQSRIASGCGCCRYQVTIPSAESEEGAQ